MSLFRALDLLCSVKYKNNLPDIPFDPKFLPYPFDAQRYRGLVCTVLHACTSITPLVIGNPFYCGHTLNNGTIIYLHSNPPAVLALVQAPGHTGHKHSATPPGL